MYRERGNQRRVVEGGEGVVRADLLEAGVVADVQREVLDDAGLGGAVSLLILLVLLMINIMYDCWHYVHYYYYYYYYYHYVHYHYYYSYSYSPDWQCAWVVQGPRAPPSSSSEICTDQLWKTQGETKPAVRYCIGAQLSVSVWDLGDYYYY